jgi:hypothetical protein
MFMTRLYACTISLLTILLGLSACQQNEATTTDTQATLKWQSTLDSLEKELAPLDDKVAQTTLLRNYAGALLDVGFVPESLNQRYRSMIISDTNVVYWHNLFLTDAVPTHCDVISKFYVYLLSQFGFKATNYTYGLKNTSFTHTVTAIDIGSADQPYIILQDPTLATLYLDQEGEAIHLPELWTSLKQGDATKINWSTDTIQTHALVIPEAAEAVTSYLGATADCETTLAEYHDKRKDNPNVKSAFYRHYRAWADHCDRFDQRFLAALEEAGYTVDLQSALLVQTEVWGGHLALTEQLQALIKKSEVQ